MHTQDHVSAISAQVNALAAQVRRLQDRLQQISTGPPPASRTRPGSVVQAPTSPTQAGAQSTHTGVSHFTVATELCRGCGLCARIAPRTFTMDGQTGKANVSDQGGDQAGLIQMAIARCPTGAIRYE